jgi:hypothetical protein
LNNWQPIETAPKDRRILLAYEDTFVIVGMYHSSREKWLDTYGNPLEDADILEAWQELPEFNGVIND